MQQFLLGMCVVVLSVMSLILTWAGGDDLAYEQMYTNTPLPSPTYVWWNFFSIVPFLTCICTLVIGLSIATGQAP